jgi:DNA-binding transcriptional ArsR family regulator
MRAVRVEGVREIMLSLLEKGPLSRGEIVKLGNSRKARFYINLKMLRDEGLIKSDKASKRLYLAGTALPTTVAAAKKAIVGAKAPPQARPTAALRDALSSVLFHLTPIVRGREKLMVLEQLAQTTPPPIAEILKLLVADVVRLSALKG